MILPMEHRTPLGLEIKMYAREAKRTFGFKHDKKDRDETEEELKARFSHALRMELGEDSPIAKVYSIPDQRGRTAPKPTQKRRNRAIMPTITADGPIPSFLGPKK